jgi:hypothetical protein
MHYKKTKIVETVVFDGEVTDISDIKAIITSLKAHEYDVTMRVKGEMILHPRVRITEVGEDGFRYSIIGKGSSLTKQARFADVESLTATSNDLYAAQMKPGITRWNLLNPTADFDSGL